MSKFSKKKKGMPAINTASLPDIVFMLLFFFMVATTMRETSVMVKQQLPTATEVKKLEDKRLISTIYVGEAEDQKKYGEGDKIQLNDKIADVSQVRNFIFSQREPIPEDERDYMTTLIKADIKSNVGTINDIKKELREINALKVTYSTNIGVEK
ncbi:ExbD/TolR family protein [Urechidicola croceus]|uniref:Biopolymer transporter ExbD n=1 Tax=Urechidicola croceus TaxID=1850246 RepID=A0A1D8PA74_9FLAO|nr:biopolymer transporter ExbD [Urechidicola croceus]AOW21453.1 biopolymer transporter ExbD [Urechidicola croceus]